VKVHDRGTEDTEREIYLSSIGRSAFAKATAGQVPIEEKNPSMIKFLMQSFWGMAVAL